MWEKGVRIYDTPEIHNNFLYDSMLFSKSALKKKKKKKALYEIMNKKKSALKKKAVYEIMNKN